MGLLASVGLIGCAGTLPADLAAPEFAVPAKFSLAGDAPLETEWWLAFQDPALSALITTALTQNFTLQSAYARVEQARASVAGQRAALFPSLSAGFEQNATRQDQDNAFRSSAGGTTITANNDDSSWSQTRTFQFAAAYEIDLWGRLRNSRNATEFDARASESAWQSAAMTLAADISANWYQLQELRARIALLQSQIDTNEDVLELTTFAFNNGLAVAADVLRQRQTVVATRSQMEQSRANAAVLEHALAVLVGQAPEKFVAPPGRLIDIPALPNTGVPTRLLMRRPDVRQQYFALAAADRRVAVALAERYPQLSLSAAAFSTTDTASLFSQWIVNLAANLTQPLFDGGARAAEVDRSEAVVAETLAVYQQSLLEALREVEDALVNEYHQKRFLADIDQQLELSAQTLENLRLRYLRGATDYLDVLNALLTRQQLQVDRLAGQRALLSFRINLYRALAGGLDAQIADDPDESPQAASDQGPVNTNADRRVAAQNAARQGARREVW